MVNQFGPISLWSVIPCYWYSSMQVEAPPLSRLLIPSPPTIKGVPWIQRWLKAESLCDYSKCAAGDRRRHLLGQFHSNSGLSSVFQVSTGIACEITIACHLQVVTHLHRFHPDHIFPSQSVGRATGQRQGSRSFTVT